MDAPLRSLSVWLSCALSPRIARTHTPIMFRMTAVWVGSATIRLESSFRLHTLSRTYRHTMHTYVRWNGVDTLIRHTRVIRNSIWELGKCDYFFAHWHMTMEAFHALIYRRACVTSGKRHPVAVWSNRLCKRKHADTFLKSIFSTTMRQVPIQANSIQENKMCVLHRLDEMR